MRRVSALRIAALILSLSLILSASGCVTAAGNSDRNPTATVTLSTGESFTMRLYYDKAPNTVKNFISLAESGFYDGVVIHRSVKYNFVQMGSPDGTSTGDAGYYIKGEFSNNGYNKNDLSHTEGMVSMARGSGYDTASSQFFIMVADRTTYDGDYAVFAKVTEGLDVLTAISKMDVDEDDRPLDEISIDSITIETYGKSYGDPKTIEKD